jgi:hypothetical protein
VTLSSTLSSTDVYGGSNVVCALGLCLLPTNFASNLFVEMPTAAV